MEHLLAGKTSKQIAAAMNVSTRTVEGHRRMVLFQDERLLGDPAGLAPCWACGKPIRAMFPRVELRA